MYYLSYLHIRGRPGNGWMSHGGECTACQSEFVVNDQQHFLYMAFIQ